MTQKTNEKKKVTNLETVMNTDKTEGKLAGKLIQNMSRKT